MSHEALVAVLTPVCNGERYLRACIESVLAQTYAAWEYVIVDNASTDRTWEIACAYAERDPRIRVVRGGERVGVIESHNRAFRQVSPEARYCKVVHADDWLFPECLARMVALAVEHPSVGVVSAYRLHGAWVDLDGLPSRVTVIPGREICRQTLLGGPYVFGSPTSVLFRADLVRGRDPFYDPATLHADEAACYEVLQHSDFGFVHQVLTFTRVHAQTVTASTAQPLATHLAGNLMILQRYGPIYLEPEEYERRRRERLRQYYASLARAILAGRGRVVVRHHRPALAALGEPLNSWRLGWALLGEAGRALLAPRSAVGHLGRGRARPGAIPAAPDAGRRLAESTRRQREDKERRQAMAERTLGAAQGADGGSAA